MTFVAALFTRITVAMAIIATLYWIFVVRDAIANAGVYPWAVLGFSMMAIPAGVGGLLLAFLPNWIVFRRTQLREDRARLVLSGLSTLLILVEVALLWLAPGRGE
jgi:hypothetical protein